MDDSGCGCGFLGLTTFLAIAAIIFGLTVTDVVVSPADSAQSTACTIQTTNNNVRVRIGPGMHREVYQYLPAERPLTVIGKATSDGRVWWRIEASDVIQAWVDSADVTAAGDCTQVPEAEAPPIVPPALTSTPEPSGTPTPVIESPPADSGPQSTATPLPPSSTATPLPATEVPATEMPEPSPVPTDECELYYGCEGTGEED